MSLDLLMEARIREWLQRSPEERARVGALATPGLPLEVQLQQEIRALDKLAAATTNAADVAALTQRANQLMLQLMVLLENEGRPLAAQRLAETRRQWND
jgi:hypothetical protein